MKQKELWINQIKGLCICLVVIYHSVITFYPHLSTFQHPLSEVLSKCWIYFNLYLAPFRMPVFFFISGYLIRRYIDSVPWGNCLDLEHLLGAGALGRGAVAGVKCAEPVAGT